MNCFILVHSSDGSTAYKLDAHFEAGKLNLYCSCAAGLLGKLCKHKLAIAADDLSTVSNETDTKSLHLVREWVAVSEFQELVVALHKAERAEQEAKALVVKLKKRIEKLMKGE